MRQMLVGHYPWLPARTATLALVALTTLAGCRLPAGLDAPSTRALESGAAESLTNASSFEMRGSFRDGSNSWTIDLELERNNARHFAVAGPNVQLEAVVLEKDAYFHGPQFLASQLGSDPLSRGVVKIEGNGWWRGSAAQLPELPDLTDGNLVRSNFLGQSANQRADDVAVDGVQAVDLSGPRADVFIAAASPHRLLRIRLKPNAVVDGIKDGDLRYSQFNHAFGIAAPANVIDFSNLSTLPPTYTVLSVDTTKCASPCTVSAVLKNLGGLTGAEGPSVITFTMTDKASRQVVASCQAPVHPDVGFNATTTVECTFADITAQHGNAITVTAVPDNSGRGLTTSPNPLPSLSCRIPVVTSAQAGWVTFPGGSFQADSKANVHLAGYTNPPFFWKSYVKAYERWLPVPRDWISPDGQHYAYAEPPAAANQPGSGGIHIVDLATGADHLYRPTGGNLIVLDYENEGVYFASQGPGAALPNGLSLLDPSSQHYRQIDTSHYWQYISGGAAWGTADPLGSHDAGSGSRLIRMDLGTGVITSWYKRTDIDFLVTGADAAGRPVLQTSKNYPNQLLVVGGQDSATPLQAAQGADLPHLSNYIHPVTDANGMWLGDIAGSLSIDTPAGVQPVAHVGTGDVFPAGGCH